MVGATGTNFFQFATISFDNEPISPSGCCFLTFATVWPIFVLRNNSSVTGSLFKATRRSSISSLEARFSNALSKFDLSSKTKPLVCPSIVMSKM